MRTRFTHRKFRNFNSKRRIHFDADFVVTSFRQSLRPKFEHVCTVQQGNVYFPHLAITI